MSALCESLKSALKGLFTTCRYTSKWPSDPDSFVVHGGPAPVGTGWCRVCSQAVPVWGCGGGSGWQSMRWAGLGLGGAACGSRFG